MLSEKKLPPHAASIRMRVCQLGKSTMLKGVSLTAFRIHVGKYVNNGGVKLPRSDLLYDRMPWKCSK